MSISDLPMDQSLFIQPNLLHSDTTSTDSLPGPFHGDILANFLQLLDQGQENLRESHASAQLPRLDACGLHSNNPRAKEAINNNYNTHDVQPSRTGQEPITTAAFSQSRPPANEVNYPQRHSRRWSCHGRRKSSENTHTKSHTRRRSTGDRERILERNRIAANKYRQKKHEQSIKLESVYKDQTEKRESLTAELWRLRLEALHLKNEVLKHVDCGDKSISYHLARSAALIANNIAPSPESASVVGSGRSRTSSSGESLAMFPMVSRSSSQGELPFAQRVADSLEPRSRQDSWRSIDSMQSDEFPIDNGIYDLVSI